MGARTALVTGVGRGLGKGTAEALVRAGYRVIAAGRGDNVEAVVRELSSLGDVRAARVDIGSDASVDELSRSLRDERVDVLVNCAGVILEETNGDALSVPPEVVAETINVNSLGAYRMTQKFLPGMNERGFGRVVNVSSGMGALTEMGSGHPAYRISKAALSAVTIAGAHVARRGVLVNAVCPGWVRTDMGGKNATRSIAAGVSSITWAIFVDDLEKNGGFFRDGKRIPW